MIFDIIKKLPDASEIEIISNDGKIITIRSSVSKFSLSRLPKDEFPIIETKTSNAKKITVKSEIIFNLINKTKFAISNEETRYFLNGLYFNINSKNNLSDITFVGTDGHRLATSSINVDYQADEIPGVIIPKKTIIELSKLLSENYDDIEITISSNKIIFYIGNIILISKLIDGNFPDYTRVIPKNNSNNLIVDRRNLLSAVDRVSTIANDKSPSIKFKLLNNLINLSSNNNENSTATEDIQASYNGDEINIGFNSIYIMDILENIEGDEVKIAFKDSSSPIIIKENISTDNTYVLMPMRV